MDPISELQAGGFSEAEISEWATKRRDLLTNAGFKTNEIDAYFAGGPVVPEQMPTAIERRLGEGEVARKREGGLLQTIPQGATMMSTPDGRQRLWEAVKQYPSEFVKSMIEQVTLPGEVAAGKIDLSTDEGLEKAIGLGTLVGFGRPSKLTLTGKTSGLSVAMGEQVARIERGPTGEIYDLPVGTFPPESVDFTAAAKVVASGDVPKPMLEKLLRIYEEEGLHPAEVAHDAGNNPVVAQKLLSRDPADLPYGGKPPPPPEPPKPPKPPAPEPGSFEEAQQKILDRISVGEHDATRRMTFDRLYTEMIDDMHPIKAVTESGYELARLTRGQFGKAEYFLEQGTFDFNTLKSNGKSFGEIVAPVGDDLSGLRAYLTSKRALEVEASGRKTGVDVDAAQIVVDHGNKQYGKIANEVVAYEQRVLAYLRDSGVLTDKAFDAMVEAGQAYVPFYRLLPEGTAPKAGSSLGPGNPIKRLKGSEREIIDPLESIIKNTYAYISIAERNAAGIEIIDALKAHGIEVKTHRGPRPGPGDLELLDYLKEHGVTEPDKLVDFIKNAAPERTDTLSAFRDGVRQEAIVNDPDLVAAFNATDRQSVGLLTKIFSVPARTLRAGAVLTPDFMVRNLIRDFLTAFVNTSGLIFSPIDTLKGLSSVLRKDEHWGGWVKGGGANSTMVALDRAYLQESLIKLNTETGLMRRAWNVVTAPIEGLRVVSELIENATRVGEFRKLATGDPSKQVMQAAAFASREVTLDFARMGAKMRSYNMLIAFANAQIQGVDRIGRAFIDRPVNTSLKVAGGITLPSVLLWWANHDDQRYQELPNWQKDLFWIILTDGWEPVSAVDAAQKPAHLVREKNGRWEFNNGSIWRIPKPFELGVIFGSGPERLLEATIGKSEEAFKGFTKSVIEALTPSVIPTAAQPLFEQWANRSSFTNRTLIPGYLEKQLPEYQYTPYTTELSKKLGRVISAFPGMREEAIDKESKAGPAARALTMPILIENYVRSWTGGLGMYLLEGADKALREAGVLPDPIKPTSTLADIPFIKAFAVRYPSATTQSIQDFYDEHGRNKRFFDTYMAKAEEGDTEAMEVIEKAGGPEMFAQLDTYKETLTGLSKLIRDIYKNPTQPADEKRQLIDSFYYSMIEIARGGREIQREIKKPQQ